MNNHSPAGLLCRNTTQERVGLEEAVFIGVKPVLQCEVPGPVLRPYGEEDKMQWPDIRKAYPDQWLVIEALEAHTTPDRHRVLDRLAVVDHCLDGASAFQAYRHLHQQHPQREFYSVHTSKEELEIEERRWLGIRRAQETVAPA